MLNPLQNAQIMMSNFKLLKSMILYYISKTIQNVRHLPAQIDSEYTFSQDWLLIIWVGSLNSSFKTNI